MQKDSRRNLFRTKVAKNKYILIFLSLGLLSWYLFDVFYRPTYTHEFPFTQGEHVWDVDIRKGCIYTVRLTFVVPENYEGDLTQLFGNLQKLKHIPVPFTIGVFNKQGVNTAFYSYDKDNNVSGLIAHGGGYTKKENSIAYGFATLIMPYGKYKIIFNVLGDNYEIAKLKTSLSLSSSIKNTCPY